MTPETIAIEPAAFEPSSQTGCIYRYETLGSGRINLIVES